MNVLPLRPKPMAALAAIVVCAAGCAGSSTVASPSPTPKLRLERPVVLLGEVHDNAAQHALRLRALQVLIESGARPALAMEQFDRELQPRIDALLVRQPSPSADELIALTRAHGNAGAAATAGGWNWDYYRPYVELALRHRLRIVAANVSRAEARGVMRDGLAANGFDPVVPGPLLQEIASGIEASHCGLLDAPTAARMALAQVARDQFMARVVEQNAAQGVVLLAGNGHVRTDIGAPRWLPAATRARSEAIGVLEAGDAVQPYDRHVTTAVQSREDPCAAMKPPAAIEPRKPA